MYKVFVALCCLVVISNAQDCTLPKTPARDCCPGFMPSGLTPAVMSECKMPPESSPINQPQCPVAICILNKMNILTPDNKIVDRDTFISMMDTQFTGEFKQLVGPAYDICVPQSATAPCPQMAFMLCIKTHMFKNCPASIASNNPDCVATKAFFDRCVLKA